MPDQHLGVDHVCRVVLHEEPVNLEDADEQDHSRNYVADVGAVYPEALDVVYPKYPVRVSTYNIVGPPQLVADAVAKPSNDVEN